MNKEQILNKLKSIRVDKEKAIENQDYGLASQLRDVERELIEELIELEEGEG